jgi:segregation and condensation protein B
MARRKTPKNTEKTEAQSRATSAPDEPTLVDAVPEPIDDEPTAPMRAPAPAAEQDTAAAKAAGEADVAAEAAVELGAEGEGSDAGAEVPVAEAAAGDAAVSTEPLPLPEGRLGSIIESLLFAADKPLGIAELKRLLGERDVKKITAAIEALKEQKTGTGVQVVPVAGGWQLRTSSENAPWVGKLMAGKPVRLSRAMMETVAIVAYRQPITRPEIDDIRGVDCGPVLKTLLDRGLVRIIGKKEDVGRPLLYGTTPEFLKTFSLNDLMSLPTLQQFHELAAEEMAKVDAQTGGASVERGGAGESAEALGDPGATHPAAIADADEDDGLLRELDRASQAAAHVAAVGATDTAPDALRP